MRSNSRQRVLLVHSAPIDSLGGAELSLKSAISEIPSQFEIDAILPEEPVSLDNYDTVITSNLRPSGGLGEAAEYKWAALWTNRLKWYSGYVIRMEHDVHPCTYRDGNCIDIANNYQSSCNCSSPIPKAFEKLYNISDAIMFLSPLHRRVINQIIKIKVKRQYDIGVPVDFDTFTNQRPFDDRKHMALVIGDEIRISPETFSLAEQAGYPVEHIDYLTIPYAEMPKLLNEYKAVIVAPKMLHAFGRLVTEAMACGCQVLTNNRVGALSFEDPIHACQVSNDVFWNVVGKRPLMPNYRRFLPFY